MLVLMIVVRIAITAVAFAVTAWLLSGVDLSGGVLGALWVSVLFGVVNAVFVTLARFVPLPASALVVGLLALLLNAVIIEITDALTGHLTVDEFWWTAIWASILLSVVIVVLEVLLSALAERRTDEARPAYTA